ncbi:MAG: glycosyltransferase family 39 protein [Betaproteobacteria bacterium]
MTAETGSPTKTAPHPSFSTDTLLVAAVAVAKLALNLAFAGRYGYFRDELYYIACADHLAWGYVDHPPLSIAILALTRRLLGDSLYAIRFPAALAGAATVVLTGLMARKVGGGRFAQLLAATAAALSPAVLGNAGRYFSMNAFDLLFWAAAAYLLLAIVLDGNDRLWVLFGVVAGLGVMNKYSMLFFGAGVVVGLVLTEQRRDFARPWIWVGGALAALIVVPHVAWEVRHGFPSLVFIHNASTLKNVAMSPVEFMAGQAMETGLGQTVLWVAGLAFFAIGSITKRLRVFAWAYVAVLIVMLVGRSKPYYLTPIYFPYLAAGAVAVETLGQRANMAWIRLAAAAAVIVFGIIALPFAVPVLPVDDFIGYERALGQMPKPEEREPLADLPQYYADMFGWERMVAKVAAVYRSLTPEEQRHTVIYARNYGEAAALDFFGRRYGLPKAVCAHNSYWYWGTGVEPMRVAIVFGAHRDVNASLADLRRYFDTATLAATTGCEHCMPYESHRAIVLCRGPHFTFRDIWSKERMFI